MSGQKLKTIFSFISKWSDWPERECFDRPRKYRKNCETALIKVCIVQIVYFVQIRCFASLTPCAQIKFSCHGQICQSHDLGNMLHSIARSWRVVFVFAKKVWQTETFHWNVVPVNALLDDLIWCIVLAEFQFHLQTLLRFLRKDFNHLLFGK